MKRNYQTSEPCNFESKRSKCSNDDENQQIPTKILPSNINRKRKLEDMGTTATVVKKLFHNSPQTTTNNYAYFNNAQNNYNLGSDFKMNPSFVELIFNNIDYSKLFVEITILLQNGYNIIVTTTETNDIFSLLLEILELIFKNL